MHLAAAQGNFEIINTLTNYCSNDFLLNPLEKDINNKNVLMVAYNANLILK